MCKDGRDKEDFVEVGKNGIRIIPSEAYKQRKFSFKLNTTVEGAKGVIADLRKFMEQQGNTWAFEELSFENL